MGDDLYQIFLIIGSYLLGAIPFGLITAKTMGRGDIRKMGSGNIGATNVLRNVGKLGGLMTLLLDSVKGIIPVLIAESWWGMNLWTLGVALAAILGHNFPVYLGFKGGKGVATSLGVVVALWPPIGLIMVGIWVISVFIWRYSSLAALTSFSFLPIIILIVDRSVQNLVFSFLISAMIFYRHIENIKRLFTGEEKKIGKGGSSSVLILILILLLSNRIAYGGDVAYKSTIPVEVQKIWEERRVALSSGDTMASEAMLNNIIEVRYKLGINRMDEISALLVREGYQSLEKGMAEEAYKLSHKAIEISPYYAPAYFLSAGSLYKMSNIMASISECIRGLKVSVRDFWTLFNIIGRLYTVVVIAASCTFLTFLIAWLLRVLPIFFHTFREMTSGFIDNPLRPIFFGTFAILPLIFGIGWFIVFWIAGVWIYLSRKERMTALLGVAFFLLLPQVIRYDSLFITGQDNLTLQGLLAIERGYGEQELIDRLKDGYKNEPENTYLPLSIAYLFYKQGHVEESMNYYKKLSKVDQESIRISALNSIGNIHFTAGRYDDAIASYKKAIDTTPDSAIPLYNLSQAYREKLMFAEAESTYEAAKGINPEGVGIYTTLSSKGKGYKTIDYPVSGRDLWTAALRTAEDSNTLSMGILRGIIRIPPDRFFFLGISILIFLTVLSYFKPRTPLAYHCPKCNQIVCGWCTGSKIFGGLCKDCRRKDHTIEEAKGLDRRISFILPGVWHIYKGWVGLGGVISFIFFTGLSGLILAGIDDTWYMAYDLHRWFVMVWVFLILLSYLILPIHFKYIKIRFKT